MLVSYSDQYMTPCVIVEPGESAEQIITACRTLGAIYHEEGPDDECFVVQIGFAMRPPELYTEDALRRSLSTEQRTLEPGDAPGPADRISHHTKEKDK